MIVDHLIEQACERAQSSDFGPDGWREGLEVLVESMNREASLNELGEGVNALRLTENLVSRLEIEKCFKAHPEIADEVVDRPVFGLGLPRTGSTALSFLLALDDRRRTLRSWEAGEPTPPPEAATQHADPRIDKAHTEITVINEMFPDFVGMLPQSATGPQECLLLMALDFRSQLFEATARVPTYSRWLAACDMESTYRYHRRVLQLLQWHCPPNKWWLKTPAHIQHLDALAKVYPDAEFIVTHRDVVKVLPSVCALMSALSSPLTDDPDPRHFGRLTTGQWEEGLRTLIAFRDGGREDRFHDVHFADMQRDPIGTVERLYRSLGIELPEPTRSLMADWWRTNSEDRAGARRYDPAEFGLDPADLRRRFGFYTDRFGITEEN
ncbi:sulfotransferase family protein [Pseudofrankia inefficax]|uniref:Sulfotransferase n=1 Tax=Pseudofrankia inefficax (strain DSM 45817 / CECT 9037 / DDB 130130 / EuI1c) TaxID=298654 RepID=E3IVG1_PSEI1|nr:sulfotransferase [Pseudofrankia inefficax]ADP81325.1 hypothetical protein FraEuI1c_3313 [Pseudofrankia inefficax]